MKRLVFALTIILAASTVLAQDKISVEDLMKGESRTLYQIFGVKERLLKEPYGVLRLHQIYTKRLKKLHPSRKNADPASLAEMAKISLAYRVLVNSKLRTIYDSQGIEGIKDKVKNFEHLPPLYKGNNTYFSQMDILIAKEAKHNFPVSDKKKKHFGIVAVSYLLGEDKTVSDIKIENSSGFESLDEAAAKSVLTAVSKCAKQITPSYSLTNGKPVESRQVAYVAFHSGSSRGNYSRAYRVSWADDYANAFRKNSIETEFRFSNSTYPYSNGVPTELLSRTKEKASPIVNENK